MVELEAHRGESVTIRGPSALDAAVVACFRSIYDPCSVAAATPVSLYDMGLLDSWSLSGAGVLSVRLCVTFAACTMAPHFIRAAEESLGSLPGVREVQVEVDTSVVWTTERMSEHGRALLASRPQRFTAKDMPRPREWEQKMTGEGACPPP
jgi:metal-sulfur cluster biosynthetic enzyme